MTVPPPHTSGLQTQLCPQLAGLIMESHSRTALLRANSTGLPQTQLSTQKISTLALLWCGREQRDSTASAATPEALCAPGAKGPQRGRQRGRAPAGPFPSTSPSPESCWQEEELLNKEKSQHFFLFFSLSCQTPQGTDPQVWLEHLWGCRAWNALAARCCWGVFSLEILENCLDLSAKI